MGLIRRWRQPTSRTRGHPTSSNGASSMHLRWDLRDRFDALEVDLVVRTPPSGAHLYFWAIQADFVSASATVVGGAHLGLQWHSGHPGNTAVNWGGYDEAGQELDGTDSDLPSAMDNANTRDLPWQVGRLYRLRIEPAPPGAPDTPSAGRWRGTVIDVSSSQRAMVRDLHLPGSVAISGATVWSEVFAPCDDPSVAVRWSRPRARPVGGAERAGTADGEDWRAPSRALVNYQSVQDGGCTNTNSAVAPGGIEQTTNTERTTPQGNALPWPG